MLTSGGIRVGVPADSVPARLTGTATAILSGPEHVVTTADPVIRRWLGDRDLLGRRAGDALPKALALPDLSAILDEIRASGRSVQLPGPLAARFDRDGNGVLRDLFLSVTLTPVPGPEGVDDILLVASDITADEIATRRRGALADREQLLLRLATAANQVSGTEAKLVALAETAVPALSDVCAINLLDGPLPPGIVPNAPVPTWRITAPTSVGVIGPPPGKASRWTGGDPASAAIAAGRTVVYHYEPENPPSWAAAAGVDAAIRDGRVHCTAMVPVIVDGLVHAVVAFGAGPDRAAYGDDDLELFELIADQTAAAMRQGDLYDSARSTALTLQRAMLTAPPPVDGLDIAVRYRPAGQDEVGGDWYDAFLLDSGELGLVVGDIAGHDLTAATVMGQVRSMLRGFAIHDGGAPDQTLAAVDHVIRRLRLTLLATCLYACLDPHPTPAGHPVTWSNAGHSAPVVLHPDGTTTVLDGVRDPALGILWSDRRSDRSVLPVGATLLIFSDGLYERRGLDLDESLDVLLGEIGRCATLDLDDLCDALLRSAPHDDDVALIALRARPVE